MGFGSLVASAPGLLRGDCEIAWQPKRCNGRVHFTTRATGHTSHDRYGTPLTTLAKGAHALHPWLHHSQSQLTRPSPTQAPAPTMRVPPAPYRRPRHPHQMLHLPGWQPADLHLRRRRQRSQRLQVRRRLRRLRRRGAASSKAACVVAAPSLKERPGLWMALLSLASPGEGQRVEIPSSTQLSLPS